jgi:SAM-dependent methyltransferase
MSGEVGTTRRYLEQQYSDDANLAARQSIYAYQRPRLDLYNAAFDLAALRGDEAILDIGCGNGRYLSGLETRGHRGLVCGADLSTGMLQTARNGSAAALLRADAQAIPFAADSFDVVLAMHMLYHVPDRPRALAEMRRVLQAGGAALVLTNSVTHFQELDALLLESAEATVDPSFVRPRASLAHYTVEGAVPDLEAVFPEVTAHLLSSELVVDDVEPVVAYARSLGSFVTDSEVDREPVLRELGRRVSETIASEGAFRVTTACGIFVCR